MTSPETFLWLVTYIWMQSVEQQPHILHAKLLRPGKVNHSLNGFLLHSPALRRVPEVWTQCSDYEIAADPCSCRALYRHHTKDTFREGMRLR